MYRPGPRFVCVTKKVSATCIAGPDVITLAFVVVRRELAERKGGYCKQQNERSNASDH